MLSPLPAQSKREQILNNIWRRFMGPINCTNQSGYVVKNQDRRIPLPKKSASAQDEVRLEYFMALTPEFSDPVSFKSEYAEVDVGNKKITDLIHAAEKFFNEINSIGAEILQYCEYLEGKLISEFQVKNCDQSPNINDEEYANYQILSLFIFEKQLGITPGAIIDSTGPLNDDEQFCALVRTHGSDRVWFGPEMFRDSRRKLIDDLIDDRAKVEKFVKIFPEIKERAEELSLAFGGLRDLQADGMPANVISATDSERARTVAPTRQGARISYDAREGRLAGPGGTCNFNAGTAKTILEALILYRRQTRQEIMALIELKGTKAGSAKKAALDQIAYLKKTFEDSGLPLRLEIKDENYILSEPVQLEIN